MAQEWKVINRDPRIRLLRGERSREFVLSHAQEWNYLEFASQPLKDAALLINARYRLARWRAAVTRVVRRLLAARG